MGDQPVLGHQCKNMQQTLSSDDSGVVERWEQLVEVDAAEHILVFLVARRRSVALQVQLLDAGFDELEEIGAQG